MKLWRSIRFPWKAPDHDPLRKWFGFSYRDYASIKGRIVDGRYYSPLWNLSCAVPKLEQPSSTISDDVRTRGEEELAVSFADDVGNAYTIRAWKTPGLAARAAAQGVSDQRLNEASFALFRRDISQMFPNQDCIHQESLPDGSVFAVLQISRGSNLINTESGEALDSTRGYQVSHNGDIVLIIGAQRSLLESTPGKKMLVGGDGSISHHDSAELDPTHPWQSLQAKCLEFAQTVKVGS